MSFAAVDLSEALLPTTVPGVDCLLAGQSPHLPESFATHRMNELLLHLHDKYSIILMHGPPVDRCDDLELLAAYASGILYAIFEDDRISPQAGGVVSDMLQLGAPVIGATIVTAKKAIRRSPSG